jgi:hypothetical protein
VTLRLVDHLTIPLQTALLQLLQNCQVSAWYATGAIDIFHANQPLAMVRAGIEVTGQSRYQGASMQFTGG